MYTNVIGSVICSLIAASILVLGFNHSAIQSVKLIWFIVMATVLICRLADGFYWFFKLKNTAFDGLSAKWRFLLGAIITGLLWSIYAVGFFPYMDEIEFATIVAILCALAGGSSTTLSGHKVTSVVFVVLTLVPVSALALFSGVEYRMYLGLLGLAFATLMAVSSARASHMTTETIALRNENTILLEQMKKEVAQVDDVHEKLSDAYSKLNDANATLEKEVERRTDKIRQLSNLDPLTGLYNRSAFISQLNETTRKSVERGHSVALLFIDLNGFKKINDTLGHKIGDAVLIEIARRLGAFANDYQAGRWGGDEFLMLLPYASRETAISVATAVQARIAQPLDVMSNLLHLNASVGIAMLPEHTSNELELIQLADFAMFEQKKLHLSEPRMFTHDLFQNLKNTEKLRDGLQEAIARKQLYLCYQPIMDQKTGTPWSYEALLRWNFGDTLVRPDIFIPLAEQSGLIHEIGAWVLNRACIDASQWQHSPNASVSVNVSVIQLMDDDFIHILDKALSTSGLAPERLHVEITESMFADNKKRVRAQLDAIKSRNIQVSIDDFGTGYSSLSQLQTMSFDTIKIDRSFVQNLDQGGEAIIRATMFIAREFGSKTVAEGIETEQDAAAMKGLGVDYLQGFLFAKPMVNDNLSKWVSNLEKKPIQFMSSHH